jgi:tripartite-type tricarboxylate transporter receptor subunit TctC
MTISITRRLALTGIAAFTATGLAIAPIAAQDYPSGEIEYIVPYNPGGASDTIARTTSMSSSSSIKVC